MQLTYLDIYRSSSEALLIKVREQIVKAMISGEQKVTEICRKAMVSRRTAYKWLKRYLRGGRKGLKNLSRRAKLIWNKTEKSIEEAIVFVRKKAKFVLGPVRIQSYLKKHLATGTIYNILKRNNALRKHKKRKKRKKPSNIRKPSKPRQEWQMDLMHQPIFKHGYRYISVIKDTYTKECVGLQESANKTSETPIQCLEKAVKECSFKGVLWTDNGGEFISKDFEKACKKLGIKHRFIAKGHPEENASVERLNRTIREECINVEWFKTPNAMQTALNKFRNYYNTKRVHSSIGMTPKQKLLE